jgi:hypothetical protein
MSLEWLQEVRAADLGGEFGGSCIRAASPNLSTVVDRLLARDKQASNFAHVGI